MADVNHMRPTCTLFARSYTESKICAAYHDHFLVPLLFDTLSGPCLQHALGHQDMLRCGGSLHVHHWAVVLPRRLFLHLALVFAIGGLMWQSCSTRCAGKCLQHHTEAVAVVPCSEYCMTNRDNLCGCTFLIMAIVF